MQKFISVSFVILLSLTICWSQCENGQLQLEVYGEISNNHRHNTAFTYGMVSYQSHADNFYYESEEKPAFYLGYGKSLWVGAKGQSDNLKLSANTFPYLNNHDFTPGPLDRITGEQIDTVCGVYNRVWIIKQIDVFQHQLKFQAGELTIADIPTDMLEWPAKGNPYLEEFSPDYDLAPFHDFSEDGIYDPLSGDYPIALVENHDFIPHQFSFIVYNDKGLHTETFADNVGIEFQQINYVVNCNEDSESEQSVFTRINYNYLGSEALSEFKIALWEDNDMACNQNDYTGCNRDLNCSYFYQKDGESWVEDCHDPDVPDNNGAIRSTVFLSHTMKTFKHWYLLGVGDTLIAGIDPGGGEEYYNYMNGLWRYYEQMTIGGNGYNFGSQDTTKFAFPDIPTDPNGWSMQTAQINLPVDVRALTTLVDDTNVQPGATGTIDFVDHFLYDKVNKKLEVFNVWPGKIESLKSDFEAMKSGTFDCGSGLEICIEDCVWPGDVNRDNGVTGKDFLLAGVFAGNDLTDGVPRGVNSSEWFGFNADDWSAEVQGVNAKNGDVNGNGAINENDLISMEENFGKTRDGFEPEKNLVTIVDPFGIRLEFEVDTVDLLTAQFSDKIVLTDLYLGNMANELANPIYGLSFDMRFDTNLVAPLVRVDDIDTEVFEYGFAEMTNKIREGNELVGDDKIQYAFTNFSGEPSLRGGKLAFQNLLVKDDAKTANLDATDTLVVRFYNVCGVNSEGEPVEIGAFNDTLILTNLLVDTTLMSSTSELELEQSNLKVYPNPTSDILNVEFEAVQDGNLIIYDLKGRVMTQKEFFGKRVIELNFARFEEGLYILHCIDSNGTTSVKSFIKS